MSSISIPRGIDENLAKVLREITQQLEKTQSITDKFSIESDDRGKPRVFVKTPDGKASIGATIEERRSDTVQDRNIDAKRKDILNVRKITCDEIEASNDTIRVGNGSRIFSDGTDTRLEDMTKTGIIQVDTDIVASNVWKTGWDAADWANITITFDDGDRELTITPTGDITYFIQGVEFDLDRTSVTIADTEGIWFFYFNNEGTLVSSQTPWGISDNDKALVAIVYWDATNNNGILVGTELHTWGMDAETHDRLHSAGGSAYASGLGLTSLVTTGNGSSNTHAQLGYANGVFYDEDIKHTIDTAGAPAKIPVFYRSGASGVWRRVTATDYPFSLGTSPAPLPEYNYVSGGSWTKAEITSSNFVLVHLFATNDPSQPVISIMGQAQYTTTNLARAGATTELYGLAMGVLASLTPEFIPIATLILEGRTSFTNAVNARFIQPETGVDYVDWRTVVGARTGVAGVSDHGALTGLADDDHTQYALAGAATSSRLTMATSSILGRTTAATGAPEEITTGFGLDMSALVLRNTQPRSFPAQPCGYLSGGYYDFSQSATSTTARAVSANYLYLWPAFVNWDVSPLEFGVNVTIAAATGKNMRIVIYDSSSSGFPNIKLWESASFLVDGTGYKRNSTGLTTKLQAGTLYWIGVWPEGDTTISGYQTYSSLSLGLQSSAATAYYATIRRSYTAFSGTLASPFVMTSADLNVGQNAASVRFKV
jgi:hypothetical protein